MPTLTLSDRSVQAEKAEAFVVFAQPATAAKKDRDSSPDPQVELRLSIDLPAATASFVHSALSALRASAAADEVTMVAGVPGLACDVVVVAGLGAPESSGEHRLETVRRSAGSAVRALAGRHTLSLIHI